MDNLSEEEKKVIETNLKCLHNVMNNFEDDLCEQMQEKVSEIKQFIERQQAEYSDLKLKYEQGLLLHKKHVSDLEIKDKMIDELIDTLNNIMTDRPASIFSYIFKDNRIDNKCIKCGLIENTPKTCKDCIKEYFRKKVEINE